MPNHLGIYKLDMYTLNQWYEIVLKNKVALKTQLLKVIMTSDGNHRNYLLRDLPVIQYYSSLNIKSYCRRWLNEKNIDYVQGMHEGGLPSLAIGLYLASLSEPSLPFVISFAYQDDSGIMSTFCFYAEDETPSWCVAICHDPFKPPLELLFDIKHSKEKDALDGLSSIINNKEIEILIRTFIETKEYTKKPQPADVLNYFQLKCCEFDVKGEADFNKSLINMGFEVEPSTFDDLMANIPNWHEFLKPLDTEPSLNKRKLNFSYQTDDGKSARFYFYINLATKEWLLALDDGSIADVEPYYFCISTNEVPYFTDETLKQFVQNEQVFKITQGLLTELAKFKNTQVPAESSLFDTIIQCFTNLGIFFISLIKSITNFLMAFFSENMEENTSVVMR